MDKGFTVLGAHQRRLGGVVVTDHHYDEWTCPECGIVTYTPVASGFETLSCYGMIHGEHPVWMTRSERHLSPRTVTSRLSPTPPSPRELSASSGAPKTSRPTRRSRSGRSFSG